MGTPGADAEVVRAEFREVPRLALTLSQARRLWSLREGDCRAMLEGLVREGYLRKSRDGRYRRADTAS